MKKIKQSKKKKEQEIREIIISIRQDPEAMREVKKILAC